MCSSLVNIVHENVSSLTKVTKELTNFNTPCLSQPQEGNANLAHNQTPEEV